VKTNTCNYTAPREIPQDQLAPLRENLLDAARSFHDDLGWMVIPVCGKKARCYWKTRLPSNRSVDRLILGSGTTGLAVLLGERSGGLVCRDFDEFDAYSRWVDEQPALAMSLPTAKTTRGMHVYAFSETPVRLVKFGDGELRGSGHYTVVPPSIHPSGTPYRWVRQPRSLIPTVSPCQLMLLDQIDSYKQSLVGHSHISELGEAIPPTLADSLMVTIDEVIKSTLPLAYGQRNGCLFRLAKALRSRMDREAPDGEIELIVREWHAMALATIRTKDWQTSWGDFRRAWTYADPCNGFETYLRAKFATDAFAVSTGDEKRDAILRVFFIGESWHGERQEVFPGVRTVSSITGIPYETARRRIAQLADDGIIICVREADWHTTRKTGTARFWSIAHGRMEQWVSKQSDSSCSTPVSNFGGIEAATGGTASPALSCQP